MAHLYVDCFFVKTRGEKEGGKRLIYILLMAKIEICEPQIATL